MVLTTLLLRLQKTIRCLARESFAFISITLGLTVLCVLLTGCAEDGGPASGTGFADPGNGNGHAYGLNRGAEFNLSPSGLDFSATQGGSNPTAQTISISNSGSGTLDWSASTAAPWLSLSSSAGTAPGSLTVTPNITGLGVGTYSTTIVVSGNGPGSTTQSIPVDLTISTSTFTSTSTSTPATPPPPTTASVFLSWSPVQDSSVTGYYVHFGLQSSHSAGSCTYTQSTFYSLASLSNKSAPLVSVTGLTANTTYYFAVSAYNGKESACSNEVSTFTQTI